MNPQQIKVLDTETLTVLAKLGQKLGYNRQLDVDELPLPLDPEGWHIVNFALPHDHIAGKPVKRHMRLVMMVKLKNVAKPAQFHMDVPMEQYDLLPYYDSDDKSIYNHDGELIGAANG